MLKLAHLGLIELLLHLLLLYGCFSQFEVLSASGLAQREALGIVRELLGFHLQIPLDTTLILLRLLITRILK